MAITGVLVSVDQFLNIKLDNIKVVDEERYPHMVRATCVILPITDLRLKNRKRDRAKTVVLSSIWTGGARPDHGVWIFDPTCTITLSGQDLAGSDKDELLGCNRWMPINESEP